MQFVYIWEAIQAIVGLAIRYAGPWIVQGLIFLGINFVAQKYITTPFLGLIESSLGGGPEMVVKAFAAIQFDKCVTVILSAYATAAGGRMVLRKRVTP